MRSAVVASSSRAHLRNHVDWFAPQALVGKVPLAAKEADFAMRLRSDFPHYLGNRWNRVCCKRVGEHAGSPLLGSACCDVFFYPQLSLVQSNDY